MTLAPTARAGAAARNNGSIRTAPVNHSAGPLPDGCEPLRLMSMTPLYLGDFSVPVPDATDSPGGPDRSTRVGYESPSQFSREYRRLFGALPRRDVAALQAEAHPVGQSGV